MSYQNKYLPDPMLKPDGTRVQNAGEWEVQKSYLRALAEEHMYGTWPGRADSVAVASAEQEEKDGMIREKVTLSVNYRGIDFPMDLRIFRPVDTQKHPVIICNTFAFAKEGEEQTAPLVVPRGYVLVQFLTGDLVPDVSLAKYFNLPIDENRIYPKLPCRTIMAWAWGHSVVADYIQTRDFTAQLICTGASRGGKAALCCGIFDSRFAIAAPTIAGCGGTGTARFCGTTDGDRQNSVRSETIGRITQVFPDWFNDTYATYGPHEEPYAIDELVEHFPLDANVLRAMVAPRAVYSSDGEEDHWSNPFGTQLGWMAAQPVFEFLGVPGNNCFHIRPGVHGLDLRDWEGMIDFCDQVLGIAEHPEHEDLNKPYFTDVDITQYADWMK